MIAAAASTTGAGGTRVRPAPSRADRSRCDPDCTRRVILLPLAEARREPSAAESSRLEPVRVETGPAASPTGVSAAAGAVSAGLPQTSQ
jgi:hypothetical protein